MKYCEILSKGNRAQDGHVYVSIVTSVRVDKCHVRQSLNDEAMCVRHMPIHDIAY